MSGMERIASFAVFVASTLIILVLVRNLDFYRGVARDVRNFPCNLRAIVLAVEDVAWPDSQKCRFCRGDSPASCYRCQHCGRPLGGVK